jgi:dUTP pyrophosphatase
MWLSRKTLNQLVKGIAELSKKLDIEVSPVVKITNKSGNMTPCYMSDLAAGMDLRADLKEPDGIIIPSMGRVLIPTGIAVALPTGFVANICSRSGMALKEGVIVLNAPGVIDADFRGDIGVILINLSSYTVTILPGDRIAQMVITSVAKVKLELCEHLDSTERGTGGFGSTGKS